jgi:hypothetical protein
MRDLVLGLGLIFIGQALIWFQTNGQFVWDSFKRNPLGLAIVFGTIISYLLIKGTFFIVRYFDGMLWPGRFIAFGLGIISFTALTWYYLGEGFTTKTVISLLLAVLLVIIQILWK